MTSRNCDTVWSETSVECNVLTPSDCPVWSAMSLRHMLGWLTAQRGVQLRCMLGWLTALHWEQKRHCVGGLTAANGQGAQWLRGQKNLTHLPPSHMLPNSFAACYRPADSIPLQCSTWTTRRSNNSIPAVYFNSHSRQCMWSLSTTIPKWWLVCSHTEVTESSVIAFLFWQLQQEQWMAREGALQRSLTWNDVWKMALLQLSFAIHSMYDIQP